MILTRLVAVGVLTYSFNGAYAMTECPTVENATATATRAKAPGDEPSFGFSVDTGAGVQIVGAAGEMGSGERGKVLRTIVAGRVLRLAAKPSRSAGGYLPPERHRSHASLHRAGTR
eukprot:scaffold1345_cov223-Pinguiococcus_pyrenoidosus.AAC.2